MAYLKLEKPPENTSFVPLQPEEKELEDVEVLEPLIVSRIKVISGKRWQRLKRVDEGLFPGVEFEKWMETPAIQTIREHGGVFISEAFLGLWDIVEGLTFLSGAYGSSKTTYVVTRLIVKCMKSKYFNCFYGRQIYSNAEQLRQNIIFEIKRNGWEDLFEFSEKPTGQKTITYIGNGNKKCPGYGNKFQMFGCDKTESIKGWNQPTDILVDEVNQIDFETFGMLITRLRIPGIKTQFYGMFNNCDVSEEHWLYKYIYHSEEGSTEEDMAMVAALKGLLINRHHSIYTDNDFQNPYEYYHKLVMRAGGNKAVLDAMCNGGWSVAINQQPYYKEYNEQIHKKETFYNTYLPLAFILDENTNPYFPLLVAQKDGNKLKFIYEICGMSPNNTLDYLCSEFCKKYKGHKGGVEIFGDATSKKHDVKGVRGSNLFTIAAGLLKEFEPSIRVPDSNPSNFDRQRFVNIILKENYADLEIEISPLCVNLLKDMKHCLENPVTEPGAKKSGKYKERVMVNGVRGVQPLGHLGDCLDYFICEEEKANYILFKNGMISKPVTGGNRVLNNPTIPEQFNPLKEEEKKRDISAWRRRSKNSYD